MLRQLVPTPHGDVEIEPVTEYLDALDPERARWIEGRIGLLDAVNADDTLPDPPFERVPAEKELCQLVVDYDGEDHRIVFGHRAGYWVLVWAFLGRDAPRNAAQLAEAIGLWRLPELP